MKKQVRLSWILPVGIIISLAAGPMLCQPAHATTIALSLDTFTGTGNAPPGPYGTVELNDHSGPNVEVTLVLAAGEGFVTTGSGAALTWDLAGSPIAVINGLNTTNFSITHLGMRTGNLGGTGSWFYEIDCKICGHGGSSVFTGALDFTIHNIGLNDFISNGKTVNGYLFASDICTAVTNNECSSGITGDVAASDPPGGTSVPEPSTLVLLATAVFGMWLRSRRRLITEQLRVAA